jgi:hypothetical protein
MAIITEDYCSFEVARLLKEKGFDEVVHAYHNIFDKVNLDFKVSGEAPHLQIPCPTHQMAMKWLRETYRIDIVIEISDPSVNDRKYYCMILDGNNKSYILDLFDTYEESVEAALIYCLENLI